MIPQPTYPPPLSLLLPFTLAWPWPWGPQMKVQAKNARLFAASPLNLKREISLARRRVSATAIAIAMNMSVCMNTSYLFTQQAPKSNCLSANANCQFLANFIWFAILLLVLVLLDLRSMHRCQKCNTKVNSRPRHRPIVGSFSNY